MFDHDTLSALQTAHAKILAGDHEFDRINPTPFIRKILGDSGIQMSAEFHAHAVKLGESLPDERPHGTDDREIYFLKSDGSIEYHFLKGRPDGLPMSELRAAAKCCNCQKCCVVEVS